MPKVPKVPPLSQMSAWEWMNGYPHVFCDPKLIAHFIIHHCRTIMNGIMSGIRQYVNNLPYISCRYSIGDKAATPAGEVNIAVRNVQQMRVTQSRVPRQYWRTLALSKIIEDMEDDGMVLEFSKCMWTNEIGLDTATFYQPVGVMGNNRWHILDVDGLDGEEERTFLLNFDDRLEYNPRTLSSTEVNMDGPYISYLIQNPPPEGWGDQWIEIPTSTRFPNACVTAYNPQSNEVFAEVHLQEPDEFSGERVLGLTMHLYSTYMVTSTQDQPNAPATKMFLETRDGDTHNYRWHVDVNILPDGML